MIFFLLTIRQRIRRWCVPLSPFRGLAIHPEDPWPGTLERGSGLMAHILRIADMELPFAAGCWQQAKTLAASKASDKALPNHQNATLPTPSIRPWIALHSFDWLRDLDASGDPTSLEFMQKQTLDWLKSEPSFNEFTRSIAYRSDVLGQRLWLLLVWFPRLTYRHKTLERLLWRSMNEQAERLYREVMARNILNPSQALPPLSSRWPHPIKATLQAFKGLIAWQLCQPETFDIRDREVNRVIPAFESVLSMMFLPDGGTVTRNPSMIYFGLRELTDIRDTMVRARYPVPQAMQRVMDRMAPALRFFRHNDGGLALFQGGMEFKPAELDLLLLRCGSFGNPPLTLPISGYHRVKCQSLLLLCDFGGKPSTQESRPDSRKKLPIWPVHSNLALEISADGERLITSIGGYPELDNEWRRHLKNAAAFSTQAIEIVDDPNRKIPSAVELSANRQKTSFKPQTRPSHRAPPQEASRQDREDGIWLNLNSDRLKKTHWAVQQRHIWLSPDGYDLRAEDHLIDIGDYPIGSKLIGCDMVIRFHLPPTVMAEAVTSPTESGRTVNLFLPSGRVWQFLTLDHRVEIAESVYLGIEGEIRDTQQLVIRLEITNLPLKVLWQLRRIRQ
ncbi:MAG: heparinase II/III family protein [Candidatus Pacebacteria bacterium]|nr:heparinase II/III family protein [Candidatus Paceibacterota bacterium]